MKILLVGATGAIGRRRLVPLLVGAGHTVTGTTPPSRQGHVDLFIGSDSAGG